jgi:hypothetical protein
MHALNGEAERGMRGPVVGRKNHYYGSRSEMGTLVAALFYTLIETCKRLGIDPGAYLKAAALHALDSPGSFMLPSQFAERLKAAAEPDASP